MKVRVNEEARKGSKYGTFELKQGKVYEVCELIETTPTRKWYRIVDESGEDYLYPPYLFNIVEE